MKYKVSKKDRFIQGEVSFSSSKSICNRLLIINALTGNKSVIHNLSESDDTKVLYQALINEPINIDIGHAGTSMRFLTAYLAAKPYEKDCSSCNAWACKSDECPVKIITGSDRMQNRPIGVLVNALRQLGAKIEYAAKEGFPPLRIEGTKLKGGYLEIDGSVSSQYITAILLIAPTLEEGITLKLTGKIISQSYIKLTLDLMRFFGIEYHWENDTITIKPQIYQPKELTAEADWSSASYWYEMIALSEGGKVHLSGLLPNSLQGDAKLVDFFAPLGVKTVFDDKGCILSHNESKINFFEADFINNPDIAQTLAVTLVLKKISFKFTGLDTLRIKETDRIKALQVELAKMGANLVETTVGTLEWDGKFSCGEEGEIIIKTYDDHRMAMAFAPAAMMLKELTIEDPMVVTKSYPEYWDDLQKVGFSYKET